MLSKVIGFALTLPAMYVGNKFFASIGFDAVGQICATVAVMMVYDLGRFLMGDRE